MKGQMFIVLAVLVLLALILLKTESGYLTATEQHRYQTSLMLPENFENLKNELAKAVEISLLQNKSAQLLEANINNFTNFSYDIFSQKNYTFKVLYSFAFVNSTNLTIAVGNFLGEAMQNITINQSLTNEGAFISSLVNRQSALRNYTYAAAAAFNITVTYYKNNIKYNFSYASDTNKTVSYYFDVYLQTQNSYITDKLKTNLTT